MSVAMYTSQVNRLSGELARIQGQLADERKKLADANGKALRAGDALRKASSSSQLTSKARELERLQRSAADHEKKAADLAKKAADKQKSLSAAQSSLDRAQRDQQKKTDRELDQRRKADIAHIREMEQARRRAASLPEHFQPRPAFDGPPVRAESGGLQETFDVCLSFAGEQRDYVERIAIALKDAGLRVFSRQFPGLTSLRPFRLVSTGCVCRCLHARHREASGR